MTLYKNPIQLNLLPHREAMAESQKKLFATRAILLTVLAVVLMLLAWQLVDRYVANQLDRNQFLGGEIKKLDIEIAQIATLQSEIDALKARQRAVEDLQSDRNLPVYFFEELSTYVPEGVFLKTARQDGKKITLSGLAQTQERVSEMLRNFTNTSVWLESPELLEIKLVSNFGGIKSNEKLYEFTIAVLAKRDKKILPSSGKPSTQVSATGGAGSVVSTVNATNPTGNVSTTVSTTTATPSAAVNTLPNQPNQTNTVVVPQTNKPLLKTP